MRFPFKVENNKIVIDNKWSGNYWLRNLILADRVDLSIEYLALLEEFQPLFMRMN